jgi:hypothetical protein
VEARDVFELNAYNQSLLFSAIAVKDDEVAVKMLMKLIQMGVDPEQKDNLK